MANRNTKLYLDATLVDIVKVDLKHDEVTGKITYIIHKEDGTTVIKTSDRISITDSAITVAFDV